MSQYQRDAGPTAVRFARGFLAVALAFGAAGACAQSVYRHLDTAGHVSFTDRPEAPIVARELAPQPGQVPPPSGISGRSAKLALRSNDIDRREAQRRLLQAQREMARGPDMQQGIPPSAEVVAGERRRQRVLSLQRNVDAARARAREVNMADSPAGPVLQVKNGV